MPLQRTKMSPQTVYVNSNNAKSKLALWDRSNNSTNGLVKSSRCLLAFRLGTQRKPTPLPIELCLIYTHSSWLIHLILCQFPIVCSYHPDIQFGWYAFVSKIHPIDLQSFSLWRWSFLTFVHFRLRLDYFETKITPGKPLPRRFLEACSRDHVWVEITG